MGQSVVPVPKELWSSDLPPGYSCGLFIGRMVGSLRPLPDNPNFSAFSFEITDAHDPTEMLLRYTTLERPAEELSRWENAGDVVGIVMASKGARMFMVEAYDFTRGKHFWTGYFPHVKDKRPLQEMTIQESHRLTMLGVVLVCTCVGFVLTPVGLYANAVKSSQYRQLSPDGYRAETAARIAGWIKSNANSLAAGGQPSIDPSI